MAGWMGVGRAGADPWVRCDRCEDGDLEHGDVRVSAPFTLPLYTDEFVRIAPVLGGLLVPCWRAQPGDVTVECRSLLPRMSAIHEAGLGGRGVRTCARCWWAGGGPYTLARAPPSTEGGCGGRHGVHHRHWYRRRGRESDTTPQAC